MVNEDKKYTAMPSVRAVFRVLEAQGPWLWWMVPGTKIKIPTKILSSSADEKIYNYK